MVKYPVPYIPIPIKITGVYPVNSFPQMSNKIKMEFAENHLIKNLIF